MQTPFNNNMDILFRTAYNKPQRKQGLFYIEY